MLMLSVPTVLKYFPPGIAEKGDIYIHNDPFEGGTHLPDITMVAPVIYQGKVVAYPVSMVHHADIGGITPDVSTSATSRYQEVLDEILDITSSTSLHLDSFPCYSRVSS